MQARYHCYPSPCTHVVDQLSQRRPRLAKYGQSGATKALNIGNALVRVRYGVDSQLWRVARERLVASDPDDMQAWKL